jgi:mono/diheme cytochrome c family protein
MVIRKNALFVCAFLGFVPAHLTGTQLLSLDSLPPGVTPEMVSRGKAVFEGAGGCFNCHGPEAMGLLGPNLTDSDWWHVQGSYLAILRQVLSGVPAEESTIGIAMPPRGGSMIDDADVQAVAAYVWTLSHPEANDSLPAQVTPQTVARGDAVFHGDGLCASCHGADASGNIGPDLTDDAWLHAKGSFLSIVSTVMTGVPADQSRTRTAMPPRGGANLSEADVFAVAAYVWALSRAH